MRISVIIPTYKPQAYLWECLDSMVAQTFPKEEFEVILVLNGCTEPYKSDIERYIFTKMAGMNVQFIHTEQGGVSNDRNRGLDVAKGEYIAFVDDDDYVSPAYLEELYRVATPDTISLCYPYAFHDGALQEQLPYYLTVAYDSCKEHENNILTSIARKFFSSSCMKLIPMNFIKERRFDVRLKHGEDALFMFLISDRIKKLCFTDHTAVYYRRYRQNSALTMQRSLWKHIKNGLRLMALYTQIFFHAPLRYNFTFYVTRILGTVRAIASQIRLFDKTINVVS